MRGFMIFLSAIFAFLWIEAHWGLLACVLFYAFYAASRPQRSRSRRYDAS